MKYLKVENEPNYVRESNSKGILNIDNQALLAYKKRKKATLTLQNDVDSLKQEMQEIKSLLVKLLDK
jgi:hypothetical protein